MCNCGESVYNQFESLQFTINGYDIQIPKEGQFIKQNDKCFLTVHPTNVGIQILGDTFIKY